MGKRQHLSFYILVGVPKMSGVDNSSCVTFLMPLTFKEFWGLKEEERVMV